MAGERRGMQKAVFLDRDGTIIEDVGHLNDPSKIKFLPGAIDAVRLLNQSGFTVIIVTNQAGVAKGLFSEDDLRKINSRMLELMGEKGAGIDQIYYCPYHVEGTVEEYRKDSFWRKPNPGMIEEAAREFDLEIKNSYMVGDKDSDVEAGQRAGCKTILLADRSKFEKEDKIIRPDRVAGGLYDAVEFIIADSHP